MLVYSNIDEIISYISQTNCDQNRLIRVYLLVPSYLDDTMTLSYANKIAKHGAWGVFIHFYESN